MGGTLFILGMGLLILGFLSGVAIFLRAAFSDTKGSTVDAALAPLWGLFLCGVIGGAIFLAFAWNFPP
jgi:hypothetical protein